MTDSRLERIADKTKHYSKHSLFLKVVTIAINLFCCLLFLSFVVAAIYLPGYLELKLDEVEEQIGFYTLDPEEHPFWILVLRSVFIGLSLLPLTVVVLLRVLRKRGRILAEIHKEVNPIQYV